MKKIFEHISSEYQILRGLLAELERDSDCRLCLTLGSEEHLDEGIFILGEAADKFIKKYGIEDVEVLPCEEYEAEKVKFRLFGIKFEGYRRCVKNG